jgi:YD repeat-containing protein
MRRGSRVPTPQTSVPTASSRQTAKYCRAARSPRALLALLTTSLIVLCAALGYAALASASSKSSSVAEIPGEVQVVRELPSLRTATSDTFLQTDGSRVARVYATPVNFRAANGEWQPIDDTLVNDANGWHTAASPVAVALPSSLTAGPVTVGSGSQNLAFQFESAAGTEAHASGSELTYTNVQPGVTAAYAVFSEGIRETLSLASAEAPTLYTYKLTSDSGVRPSLTAAGGVAFTAASGKVLYEIAPPTVSDSAPGAELPANGQAHYELSSDGSTLSLVLSKSWLQDPKRVFPVRIDPDVYFSEQADCSIVSGGYATSNLCGGPLYVGPNSETPKAVARSMLEFNLSCIPRDAAILHSRLGLWFNADTTTSPLEIEAYGLTRGFTQKATWDTYNGTNSWTTPGGDFSTTLSGKQTILDSYKDGWVNWGFTPLVQQWVQEPNANYGVILKAHNETGSGYDEFLQSNDSAKLGEPNMEIVYVPRTGSSEGDILIGDDLAGGGEATVNAANGNLLVTGPDVKYPGEGYETGLTRNYNSEDENLVGSSFGTGWVLSTGNNALLYPSWWDRSYAFHEPGGGWTRFDPTPPASSAENQANLTYKATPGLNATLVAHENGTRTVTFNETGTEWQFDSSENGFPQKIVEPEGVGNTISLSYTESVLKHLADTHGHELTITHDSSTGHVTKIESTGGERWEYGYNANHQLTSYKNAEGSEAKYGYNSSNGLLDEIVDASGTYVIAYESKDRVTSLRKLVNGTVGEAGSEDEISSYEYKTPASPTCNPASDAEETVVTYKPSNTQETYCFDANDHFTGPKSESEEPEGSETPEEIPAGTCYEDSELHKADCEYEEELPETVEDLPAKDYGISDNNYIALEEPTEQQKKEGETAKPFFDYFASEYFTGLHTKEVRRIVPWDLVSEAEHDEQDPAKKANPGAKRLLEDVEQWIKLVKASGAEPYISFDDECNYKTGHPTELTEWDDPRELSKTEEEHDDYPCSQAPTKAQYKAAVERFLKPIPAHAELAEVRYFTALNEPNNRQEVGTTDHTHAKPTWDYTGEAYPGGPSGARVAGEYWRALHDLCNGATRKAEKRPECYVAAGDFLDANMVDAWKEKLSNKSANHEFTYFHEYIRGMGSIEKAYRWAWHAYEEGEKTLSPTQKHNPGKWWASFKYFQKAVDWAMRNDKCVTCRKPNIWLTEQGVVFFKNELESQYEVWHVPAKAEQVLNAYVKHGKSQLTRVSSQISRFFYYSMRGAPGFDSGLLEAAELPPKATERRSKRAAPSTPREIYRIYKQATNYGL